MGRRNSGPRLRWLEKRGCWYIAWSENGRSRERSTGTRDRDEAEIALAKFIEGRRARSGPRDPNEVTVTETLTAYGEDALRRKELGKVAAVDRIGYALDPLARFWEGVTAAEVTTETVGHYQRWRERSPGTVRRELGVLRAALNLAFRSGIITRQIAVELPAGAPPKDRWLTRSEVAAMIRAARRLEKGRHIARFILVAVYSGKRKEAILSLRWPQVDLDAGVVNWERSDGRQTTKRRGRNPVNPKLLGHLRRWRRYGSDLGPVIEYRGRPVTDVKRGFKAACQRAGVAGATPHTMRHTCATWLMQAGVPTWQASGFLGMTEETLLRTYGHHHPNHQQHAARAF